ncbi:hypothetical protein [Stigmatella hybrida]|uniref:hypothetical protein n=1 Tax=Stigmatella hybrida TaxID=394097 RepID=UPI001CDB044F|nr:hypothetical protein [Stigmatella hybrida]
MLSNVLNEVSLHFILVLCAAVGSLVPYVIQHYAKPNIMFQRHQLGGDSRHQRFVIRNFESTPVPGPLVLELHAYGRIQEVEVFAGPWVKEPPRIQGKTAYFTLSAFPAEGVVVVKATTESPVVGLTLKVSEHSKVMPRNFEQLRPWTFWRQLKASLAQWIVGLLIALLIFTSCIYVHFQGKLWAWDVYLISILLLGSLLLYGLMVPIGGRETIAGYLGWNETGHLAKAPADDTAPLSQAAPRLPKTQTGWIRILRFLSNWRVN